MHGLPTEKATEKKLNLTSRDQVEALGVDKYALFTSISPPQVQTLSLKLVFTFTFHISFALASISFLFSQFSPFL